MNGASNLLSSNALTASCGFFPFRALHHGDEPASTLALVLQHQLALLRAEQPLQRDATRCSHDAARYEHEPGSLPAVLARGPDCDVSDSSHSPSGARWAPWWSLVRKVLLKVIKVKEEKSEFWYRVGSERTSGLLRSLANTQFARDWCLPSNGT